MNTKKLLDAVEEFVNNWLDDYTFKNDTSDYLPDEFEKILIYDAIQNLQADEEFLRKFDLWRKAVRCENAEKL